MELAPPHGGYVVAMPDFPIDPGGGLPGRPPAVLRCTSHAGGFIRKIAPRIRGRARRDGLQDFETAGDEWSAMEAVVRLELLLEARGLLIEDGTALTSPSGQDRSRAA